MIAAAQLKEARAWRGIDQRQLAEASGRSLPPIPRMKASGGTVRGTVDSLVTLIGALDTLGVALIDNGAVSREGGRGVRVKP